MTITTRLHTFFHGKLVGTDQFGNRYYTEKSPKGKQAKRWVIYKTIPMKPWEWVLVFCVIGLVYLLFRRWDVAEPSKIPPEWHGWLHYTLDAPLIKANQPHYTWEKPHVPNLTGTTGAYMPPGHLLKGGHRAASTSDYEPWKP